MSYGIKLHVWGDRACFTRPEMKVERVSYDVMTPSAARGILEAIHWKPAIRWIVDAIHVLKPIRFSTFRRNEVASKISTRLAQTAMRSGRLDGLELRVDEDRQQRATTLLLDVAYVIEAHFEMTTRAGADDNEGKHLDIFNRRVERGQCFHQPCLGVREFPAAFAAAPSEPSRVATALPPEDQNKDLGIMLLDIDHGAPDRPSLFFRAKLDGGVMRVPHPESSEVMR